MPDRRCAGQSQRPLARRRDLHSPLTGLGVGNTPNACWRLGCTASARPKSDNHVKELGKFREIRRTWSVFEAFCGVVWTEIRSKWPTKWEICGIAMLMGAVTS